MNAYQVAIEDLGFTDDFQDSKEKVSKTFRHTVHNIPTAKLRSRAAGMFARAGLELIAVDPAYTSKWASPWAEALNVTKHEAAALMISLRANSQNGRRKRHKLASKRRSTRSSITNDHSCVLQDQTDQGEGTILTVQEMRQPRGVRPYSPMLTGSRPTREQDRSVPGAIRAVHVPKQDVILNDTV